MKLGPLRQIPMPVRNCLIVMVIRAGKECIVIAIPIPPHELKSDTWYYGVHCACTRLHALCEDLFGGKTEEQHLDCSNPIEVACGCGALMRASRLHKFKTP